MADLFGLTSSSDDGTETGPTFEDLTQVLKSLTDVVNAANAARDASETTAQNTAFTGASVRKTNAEIKLDAAKQALEVLKNKFAQELDVENLNLTREDQRIKQAGAQEDLMTSGMKRFQSSQLFEQAQQDRRKKQAWSKALVKGIAEGLAHRSGQSLMGQQQPQQPQQPSQNINQQVLPQLAGGV